MQPVTLNSRWHILRVTPSVSEGNRVWFAGFHTDEYQELGPEWADKMDFAQTFLTEAVARAVINHRHQDFDDESLQLVKVSEVLEVVGNWK